MNIIIKILVVAIIGVATNIVGYSTVPTATILSNSVDFKTVEMSKEIEIWKDVIGFEGLYQVSNIGNVKSIDRIVLNKRNVIIRIKGCAMSQIINNRGYRTVSLCRNGKYKHCVVHKLVSESFVENPNKYQYPNHTFKCFNLILKCSYII